MNLPAPFYLTRKAVIGALGSWRRLAKAEAAGDLQRVQIPGYKIAHYRRPDVERLVGSGKGALDRIVQVRETTAP